MQSRLLMKFSFVLFMCSLCFGNCVFGQIKNGGFDNQENPFEFWQKSNAVHVWDETTDNGSVYLLADGGAASLSQKFDCTTPEDGYCWIKFDVLTFNNVKGEMSIGKGGVKIPKVGSYQVRHTGCGELTVAFIATKDQENGPVPVLEIDNVQSICTLSPVSPFAATDLTPTNIDGTCDRWEDNEKDVEVCNPENGVIRIKNETDRYVEIGSKSPNWMHFKTNALSFHFNTQIRVDGDINTENGWFKTKGQRGLYNQTHGLHLQPMNANYWRLRSNAGLEIYNKANERKGVLAHNNENGFGLQDGDGDWGILLEKDNYTAFSIDGEEKMRIMANGSVGICTDTPNPDKKLDVNGQVQIRDLPHGGMFVVTADGIGCLKRLPLEQLYDYLPPLPPDGMGDNLGNHCADQFLDMKLNKIENLDDPIQPLDAVNKAYVDNAIANVQNGGGDPCECPLIWELLARVEALEMQLAANKTGNSTMTEEAITILEKSEITNLQSYPNPSEGITTISYTLQSTQNISIKIVDMSGKFIAQLVDKESKEAGTHTLQFDGTQLPNGTYLIHLQTEKGIYTSKMILTK